MKTTKEIIGVMGVSSFAVLPLIAGSSVTVEVGTPPPPPPPAAVVVQPPPPVIMTPTYVYPESYVWDGYEYVGVIGTDYYYLGPDNVWLTLDVGRRARFHEWERVHANWRTYAIHNDRYRNEPVREEQRRSPDTHNDHLNDAHKQHPPVP